MADNDRKWEREEKEIEKKEREEGKRRGKNDQDAREGGREKGRKKGRKKGFSGNDDDGSCRSNFCIYFKKKNGKKMIVMITLQSNTGKYN